MTNKTQWNIQDAVKQKRREYSGESDENLKANCA